ncbi:MAG: hypothetical protein LW768_10610, partial [Rubrivivax sp.]|nr:hypothetical protein [Rubrivivax sp.]
MERDQALVGRLFEEFRLRHPRSMAGIEEARALAPMEFDRIAGTCLRWCELALGVDALPKAADAFARFSSDVNLAQGRY